MRRRAFITLLGGAAAVPLVDSLAARSQTMPVVGFLSPATPEGFSGPISNFRRGLSETGFVEGQNVALEYRWASGQFDRLPDLAADLARRPVAVIAALAPPAAVAAVSTTKTVPIVFLVGADPIKLGLVSNFNHPGGNVTGVSFFANELGAKRLELLTRLIPQGAATTLLVNPSNPASEDEVKSVQAAALRLGRMLQVLHAGSDSEIDKAFATHAEQRNGALILGADSFFNSRRDRFAALSRQHAVPMISQWREFAAAGTLMSYGADVMDTYRRAGVYTGRVLKGEKPGD